MHFYRVPSRITPRIEESAIQSLFDALDEISDRLPEQFQSFYDYIKKKLLVNMVDAIIHGRKSFKPIGPWVMLSTNYRRMFRDNEKDNAQLIRTQQAFEKWPGLDK